MHLDNNYNDIIVKKHLLANSFHHAVNYHAIYTLLCLALYNHIRLTITFKRKITTKTTPLFMSRDTNPSIFTFSHSYLATSTQLPNNQCAVTWQPVHSYLATSTQLPSNQCAVTWQPVHRYLATSTQSPTT